MHAVYLVQFQKEQTGVVFHSASSEKLNVLQEYKTWRVTVGNPGHVVKRTSDDQMKLTLLPFLIVTNI
jgi:hypothetical protein